MRVIVGERQVGKTEALLQWASGGRADDEIRIIVSHSHRESMRLLQIARERDLPLESFQFVSVGEVRERGWREGAHLTRRVVLGVDNADIVIADLLGAHDPIRVITLTGKAEQPKTQKED